MYYLYALLKKNKIGTFSQRIFYIGQTTDIKTRMNNHKYLVNGNRIKSGIIKKYGFEYIILETFTSKELCDEKEEFLIKFIGKIVNNTGPLANLADSTTGDKSRYSKSDIDTCINEFLSSNLSLRKYCEKFNKPRKTISRWCKDKGIILKIKKDL